MTPKIKLILHDRTAHADDATAAGILRIIYPKLTVLRTRDPATLRAEAGRPGVFLLDVGGRYDPDNRLFDHHQPEGAGYRNPSRSEWPYATAGLVWKAYGAQAVKVLHPTLDEAEVADVVKFIDDSVLKYIDAVDCGVKVKTAGPSLSALIASFNTSWYEPDEDVFPLVMDLAQVLLTNFIKRYAGKVLARARVRASTRLAEGRILLLDTCLPWVSVVAEEMPEVLFVLYPVPATQGGVHWQVRGAVDADMAPRIKLPASWGGREREALVAASGVPGAVFCHRSRHLAGAASFDDVYQMALKAMYAQEQASVKVA